MLVKTIMAQIYFYPKPVGEFEERLEQLQRLYIREAKIFYRQFELSHTTEVVQNNIKSAFTSIRLQGKCYPRVYLNKMTSHKFLDKNLKSFSQDAVEINHYKVNNIFFPNKSPQVKEYETK